MNSTATRDRRHPRGSRKPPAPACDTKTFKEHWDKALQQVKAQNPEEWILEDVYEFMEADGWIILRPKHIEVDY